MNNIFHVSLLEQDTTRKRRADETISKLEFDNKNGKEYKVEVIFDSMLYARESRKHLLAFYYLVF